MKFSIKDFLSICDQNRKLHIFFFQKEKFYKKILRKSLALNAWASIFKFSIL